MINSPALPCVCLPRCIDHAAFPASVVHAIVYPMATVSPAGLPVPLYVVVCLSPSHLLGVRRSARSPRKCRSVMVGPFLVCCVLCVMYPLSTALRTCAHARLPSPPHGAIYFPAVLCPRPPTYNYCHRLSGPCHLFVLSLAPRRSLPVASGQRRGRHPSFLTSFLSSFPLLLSFALSAYRL